MGRMSASAHIMQIASDSVFTNRIWFIFELTNTTHNKRQAIWQDRQLISTLWFVRKWMQRFVFSVFGATQFWFRRLLWNCAKGLWTRAHGSRSCGGAHTHNPSLSHKHELLLKIHRGERMMALNMNIIKRIPKWPESSMGTVWESML